MKTFLGIVALLVSMVYAENSEVAVLGKKKLSKAMQDAEQAPSTNGLPNISARFKPESTSFVIFADLLVWNVQESGSENWAEVITGGSGAPELCDIRSVDFDWNAGFRVGLSYGMKHDQWDTGLCYTRFLTSGNDHVSSSPNSIFSAYLGNFYVDNPTGAGINGLAYQKASMQWTIHFNIFDWELGRNYWVSKALSLRPFLGLKGGWIHQLIQTKWQHPTLPPAPPPFKPFNKGRESLKNNFWGVGPSGGLNTKWKVLTTQNHSLSLFGDFSGAIMYGHWAFNDVYRNDIKQKVSVKLSDNTSAAAMFKLAMGFGWDANFSSERYRFSSRLGYEAQFWLDQLQLYIFDTGRLNNLLTLQGGTLEFCFDF